MGYETHGEYLKIDCIGYTYGAARREDREDDDWNLHLAIEFENAKDWLKEFNKLSFIAADLRVLIAYGLHKRGTVESRISEYLRHHSDRVCKIPQHWLIIFGPHWERLNTDEWKPYTINANGELIALECGSRLLGNCWDHS